MDARVQMPTITRAQNLLWLPSLRSLSLTVSSEIELEEGKLNGIVLFRDDIHKDLFQLIVKSEVRDKLLHECWKWYCCLLDNSIRRDWELVLQRVIKGLGPTYPKEATEWPVQVHNVYEVLQIITQAINTRGDVSIDGIKDELISAHVLRTGEQDGLTGSTPNADEIRQMIWCLVGTITMLYDPKPQLHKTQLSIRPPASGLRSGGRSRLGEICCYQQDIAKCRDPLHALLAQFGEVMPKVELDEEYLSFHININYINFYTLKYVAKLNIEWVNTLNLHLQLDKRRRILRLYRFPAFCRLVWTETEDSFMSQLFADYRKSQVNAGFLTEYTFSDYLREMMLSYRLLFGIDKRSRNAFKAELPSWRNGLPSEIIPQHLRNLDDPLLLLLCTTAPTECGKTLSQSQHALNDLLWWLRGEEKSRLYHLEDFPFLGRRLLELQRFSSIQKADGWKSVFWTDRRDAQSFWHGWIAWAVLIVGVATIVLQLLQLIFQGWGTILQKNSNSS